MTPLDLMKADAEACNKRAGLSRKPKLPRSGKSQVGLSQRETMVLSLLKISPSTTFQIEAYLDIPRGTASQALMPLEGQKLVSRKRGGKAHIWSITAAGRKELEA
jgi:DNA-binding MarR family transcriptional regulator